MGSIDVYNKCSMLGASILRHGFRGTQSQKLAKSRRDQQSCVNKQPSNSETGIWNFVLRADLKVWGE